MMDIATKLEGLRLAVGEVDALAAIALQWFDDSDWSSADSQLVDRAGFMLTVIARSAATAAARVDAVHAAVADQQPARSGGEAWDYHKGTSPGADALVGQDAEIVRRIRARCPDGRYDGTSDAALIALFKRNQQVLGRSDVDVVAAMTHPR